MRLGRYKQSAADRKRYEIVYNDWLNEDEYISDALIKENANPDGFLVEGLLIHEDGKSVAFYVAGGEPDAEYDVITRIETTMQQIKEDYVTFVVT